MSEKQIEFIKAIQNAANRWQCEITYHTDSIFGWPLFVVDIKFDEADWNSNAIIIIDTLIDVAEDWDAGIDWEDNICSLSLMRS